MTERLFRGEVIEARRQRLAGTVIAAVPPSARVYTTLLVAIALAVVAILVFGSYSAGARVKGVVGYDAGIARIYPSAPAEVRAIHVRPGQRVRAGAPLITLALAQGVDGLNRQLEAMARQDAELARQLDLAGGIGASELRALEQQRAGASATIASLERQRSIAIGQIRLAEAATERAVDLAAEGAGTQRQVEDSRSALLARRAELESVNERLIAQRTLLRETEAELARRSLETDRGRSELAARRAALAEQRDQLARSDRLVLTAPVAGEVADIGVEIGQRADPDRSLATIVPGGSEPEVWLYAPSRAVGFARPGQSVRLQFDAFPYQKYGAGRGTIVEVARVPLDPAAVDPALGIQEPVFRIRVRLDAFAPRVPTDRRSLRPGMTLDAGLVLERRSLWQALLVPIFEALRG